MSERLPALHRSIAAQVRKVLDNNKAERHLRGGQATCLKYQNAKKGRATQRSERRFLRGK